jgi:hypothetical protein
VSSVPLTVDPWFVDAVARRVAAIVDPGASLIVVEVPARGGVSRFWVYAHQRERGPHRAQVPCMPASIAAGCQLVEVER